MRSTSEPPYAYAFYYTPVYQFDTNLDGGGKFNISRHAFRFSTSKRVNSTTSVGISLGYVLESWEEENDETVVGASPWDTIHRPSISFPIKHRFANNLSVGFTPVVEFSGESGADINKSLMYGATGVVLYPISKQLTLGVGLGLFDRLEENVLYPYLIINWKINEHLRITNPFRAGPAGPAGLEMVYSPAKEWELGFGGAYRSYRFRLTENNAIQSGIGENNMIAAFARVQHRFSEILALDFAGGILLNGQLSIEDSDGRELQSADYDTAPFVALTLAGRF